MTRIMSLVLLPEELLCIWQFWILEAGLKILQEMEKIDKRAQKNQ